MMLSCCRVGEENNSISLLGLFSADFERVSACAGWGWLPSPVPRTAFQPFLVGFTLPSQHPAFVLIKDSLCDAARWAD